MHIEAVRYRWGMGGWGRTGGAGNALKVTSGRACPQKCVYAGTRRLALSSFDWAPLVSCEGQLRHGDVKRTERC